MQSVYNMTKAAVIHFVKSIAVEWAGFARANTVSPGYIDTEISKFCSKEIKKEWHSKTPQGFVILFRRGRVMAGRNEEEGWG